MLLEVVSNDNGAGWHTNADNLIFFLNTRKRSIFPTEKVLNVPQIRQS